MQYSSSDPSFSFLLLSLYIIGSKGKKNGRNWEIEEIETLLAERIIFFNNFWTGLLAG
jgi:hypothetical protein